MHFAHTAPNTAGSPHIDASLIDPNRSFSQRAFLNTDATILAIAAQTPRFIELGQAHSDLRKFNQSQCTTGTSMHTSQFLADDTCLTPWNHCWCPCRWSTALFQSQWDNGIDRTYIAATAATQTRLKKHLLLFV